MRATFGFVFGRQETYCFAQHGPRAVFSHFIIEVCLCNCDDNKSQRHRQNVFSSDQLDTSPEIEDLNSKSKSIQLSAKMLLEASTKEFQECRYDHSEFWSLSSTFLGIGLLGDNILTTCLPSCQSPWIGSMQRCSTKRNASLSSQIILFQKYCLFKTLRWKTCIRKRHFGFQKSSYKLFRVFQVSKISHGIPGFSEILPPFPAFLWTQDTTVQMTSTSQDLSQCSSKVPNLYIQIIEIISESSGFQAQPFLLLFLFTLQLGPQALQLFASAENSAIQGLQKPLKNCPFQICEEQGSLRWKQKLGFCLQKCWRPWGSLKTW